jgi:SMODS and SLOG-associating 2TM effector domain 1/SMODS and SLOG-associating 2TM effector domain 3
MTSPAPDPGVSGLHRRDGSLPELSRTAATGSRESQSRYYLLLRVELVAVVIAAIAQFLLHPYGQQIATLLRFHLGTIQILGFTVNSVVVTNAIAGSLVSAVAVTVAIAAAALRFYLKLDEQWHSRRSLAEAVNGLAWRYSMMALPGDLLTDVPNPSHGDHEYAEAYGELLKSADSMNLPPPTGKETIITARMGDLRHLAPKDQRAAYLADRIDDQTSFYSRQANNFHSSRNGLRWVMIGCYVVGAALLPFNGLAAMTTAAGSLGTWIAAKHYSDLSQSYSAMARKLAVLRTNATTFSLDGPTASKKWGEFVDNLETQLDGEHQDWVRQVTQ